MRSSGSSWQRIRATNMLNISWNTWMTAWASLLWRPSFRCSAIWPTSSRSKINHRPPVASGLRWTGSSYEKSRRRRSLRVTKPMTMSRKCSYSGGGSFLKRKPEFKRSALLMHAESAQKIKRQMQLCHRPVLFHRKLEGRNQ